MSANVWLGPTRSPALEEAVERGSGKLVEEPADANAIVWNAGEPESITELLHDAIAWVQLDSAGVDSWAGLLDGMRRWTAVFEAFAPDVAEHAVLLVLAAARRLPQAARTNEWRHSDLGGERLAGRTVGIVGAGAIGRETIARLRPFSVRILAQTRSGREIEGADRSLGAGELDELLRESDYVVLAAPLTPETRGLIGEHELELLGPDGWLVNVARGGLVDTDALVAALEAGLIGGACLDVTDPEPLPPDHPLWRFDNVLVTPHVANPTGFTDELYARVIEENVRRFREGRDLLGQIDPGRGY